MKSRSVKTVLEKHKNKLMSIPGVVGAAEGLKNSSPCIKIFVVNKTSEMDQLLPEILEGFAVVLEETDKFKAFYTMSDENV